MHAPFGNLIKLNYAEMNLFLLFPKGRVFSAVDITS